MKDTRTVIRSGEDGERSRHRTPFHKFDRLEIIVNPFSYNGVFYTLCTVRDRLNREWFEQVPVS